MRIEEGEFRMLFPDEGKLLVIKSTLEKIDDGDGNMIDIIQYFPKAILPSFIQLDWCQENYVEMTKEEIDARNPTTEETEVNDA